MTLAASASRRELKRDARRDAIIDVARDCFLSLGYAGTSMSAVAARLGGSKGTLYNYFPSKEDLFAAVMERQCGELQDRLFDISGVGDAPRDLLIHYARSILDTLLSPTAVAIQRIVVAESERFPEVGRTFFECGPRMVMSRMSAYMQELMDAGRLRPGDPSLAAQQFKDLAVSGVYTHRLWNVLQELTPEQAHEQVSTAVDTFLRAYAP